MEQEVSIILFLPNGSAAPRLLQRRQNFKKCRVRVLNSIAEQRIPELKFRPFQSGTCIDGPLR